MKSKCVISVPHTIAAAVLWLALPAVFIMGLYNTLGADPRLLYLAGVTLFPAGLTMLAPWLHAYRKSKGVKMKREIQEKLVALWKLDDYELESLWAQGLESLDVDIWQKCPNTAVEVIYQQVGGPVPQRYYAYGFAKVQYPDKWDANKGIDLAVRKALASITRQIVKDENGE